MRSGSATGLTGLVLLLQVLLVAPAQAQKHLTQKQAEQLVLNIPDAIAARSRGGCPKAFVLWTDGKNATIFFSLHNPCDKSGAVSDKIGQFTVSLQSGEIWVDVDRRDS